MANDIKLAVSGEPIKNGTLVVSTKITGPTAKDKLDIYVINTPVITDIQDKYDVRFDDPSYYYGSN